MCLKKKNERKLKCRYFNFKEKNTERQTEDWFLSTSSPSSGEKQNQSLDNEKKRPLEVFTKWSERQTIIVFLALTSTALKLGTEDKMTDKMADWIKKK